MSNKSKNQIRLNYTIPISVTSKLADYCEFTGRSAADVIRQLIVDYVENRIFIRGPIVNVQEGKRTNLSVNMVILEDFDKKISKIGTRGSIIAKLLEGYLSNRIYSESGDVQSYADCYKLLKELVKACENRNNKNNTVAEVEYWQSLYASRVFLDAEVELDVC